MFVLRLPGVGSLLGCAERRQPLFRHPGEGWLKSTEEIMEILEAYDLTGSLRDAAELAGCSHHTVAGYVQSREEGRLTPGRAQRRPMLVDEFLPKVEEWVERSKGKLRADVAHEKLLALGYTGSERTTRRAVAEVKTAVRHHPRRARYSAELCRPRPVARRRATAAAVR